MKTKFVVLAGAVAFLAMVYSGNGAEILWDVSHGEVQPGEAPCLFTHLPLLTIFEEEGFSLTKSEVGVLNEDLSQYDALVLAFACTYDSPYTSEEASVIEAFVANGGGLLVLGEHPSFGNVENLHLVTERFGVMFTIDGPWNPLLPVIAHPIFERVGQIFFGTGGELTVLPPSRAAAVGTPPGDRVGIAVAEVGRGRVVISGDETVFEHSIPSDCCLYRLDNETFVRNVFRWLINRYTAQGMKEQALVVLKELEEWGEENGEKKVSKGAEYARKNVLRSLNIDPKDPSQPWKNHPFWMDEEHLDEKHGHHVFISEGKAARRLEHLCDDLPSSPQELCLGVIELLLDADQGLAQIALDEARDTPVTDPKDQKRYENEIARAEMELENAEKEREKEHYARAIGHYRKCWSHSIHAKRIAEGKISPEAILVSTEVHQAVQLYQNTPNPFHRETVIRYQIPLTPFNKGGTRGIPVSLAVYDITGRLVETLVDRQQEPGIYAVQWNGNPNRVRSGIYFYQLKTGDFVSTKKLILLR